MFSLVTNDEKLHIYIECKLCVSPWHACVPIGPCPNSLLPTSAILYDRNCYDRNCFPTVILSQRLKFSVSFAVTYHKVHCVLNPSDHLYRNFVKLINIFVFYYRHFEPVHSHPNATGSIYRKKFHDIIHGSVPCFVFLFSGIHYNKFLQHDTMFVWYFPVPSNDTMKTFHDAT